MTLPPSAYRPQSSMRSSLLGRSIHHASWACPQCGKCSSEPVAWYWVVAFPEPQRKYVQSGDGPLGEKLSCHAQEPTEHSATPMAASRRCCAARSLGEFSFHA